MSTQSLMRPGVRIPSVFNDFFKPWNDWFDGGSWSRELTMPAVNIIEQKDDYMVSLAVPGMKKEDFKIDMEGNMLTISSEKEETIDDNDKRYNRREYNYSSFSRSFTMPEDVQQDKIDAKYEDGVLRLTLPKKEEAKKTVINKQITVK